MRKAALKEFLDRTNNTQSKADLLAAWSAIPALKNKGPDVLKFAFEDAAEEPDTPKPEDYAPGTRRAINEFLKGEG